MEMKIRKYLWLIEEENFAENNLGDNFIKNTQYY
jgi:hypothetical protein